MDKDTFTAILVLCSPVWFVIVYIIGSIKDFILRRKK